jgi:tubulin epsilon
MPREIITIPVGQCGNQIALKFWDLILSEHSLRANKSEEIFDDAMSSFFYNEGSNSIPILRARSIIVDTEEGVINQLEKSHLSELFDTKHFIKGVDGAGNNWAHGNYHYGPFYRESIIEKINKQLELCDSPQCFMITHSLGGGTGSGLGTYIIGLLKEYYPEIFKFSTCVVPSEDDDVITSPYNSILALNELIENSDCVLPLDNQSLIDICNRVEKESEKIKSDLFGKNNKITNLKKKDKPYDKMNNIISHVLSNLTCSMRFEGSLNVDINDITMNLVPFPGLHFLTSSISPLFHVLDSKLEPRKCDQIFSDIFSRDYQLINLPNYQRSTHLANALICRGNLSLRDINHNLEKQKDKLIRAKWNKEGFKIGLCNFPPLGMEYGILSLSNNTSISDCFSLAVNRFDKLYKVKAHIHHYTEYMNKENFDNAINNVKNLINSYNKVGIVQNNSDISSILPIC